MNTKYTYRPVRFYVTTILATWGFWFCALILKEGLNSYYDFYFLNLDDFRNTFKDKENMQGFLKEVT